MHEVARGPLSPKTPRPALSLRPSNIASSGHERDPVSTSMELEGKEDDEHEYNGDEADEDDTIIAHSPQTSAHSPRRPLPTRNTELQVQAHWERVIREQLAASMRAKLKSKQTMEMAIANTGRFPFVVYTAEGPPSGSGVELGHCHTEADDSRHHELQIHCRSSEDSRTVGGATAKREFNSLQSGS